MKRRKIWAVVAMVVLASLACSLGGAGGEEVEEPTQLPLEESTGEVPADVPSSEEAPPLDVASDALSGLDSYRARIMWRWTPESGEPETLVTEQEETRDPQARRFVTRPPDGGQVEWVQIGDTTWYCFGDSCVQTQESPEESFGEGITFNPEEFVGSDYRYVGRETINGISTRHYVIDLSLMEAVALAQGEVTDVQAEVWVADEADLPSFVVRYTLRWTGAREGAPGQGEFSYEVYDVNAPITIEPPEKATGGFPEDVPEYPDARNMMTIPGMISFYTSDAVETVAAFYQAQLPTMGWTLEDQSEMTGMVMQTWKKEERSLELMISSGDGETSVTFVIGE